MRLVSLILILIAAIPDRAVFPIFPIFFLLFPKHFAAADTALQAKGGSTSLCTCRLDTQAFEPGLDFFLVEGVGGGPV